MSAYKSKTAFTALIAVILSAIFYITLGTLLFLSLAKPASADSNYTTKEVKCLAINIYFEARNQTIDGQLAVAWVTMNRVNNKKWPNDVCKVVWQRRQFSWTHDGKSDRPRDIKVYEVAVMIAKTVLTESRNGGTDHWAKGATHYHADYVAPGWSRSYKMKRVAIIGVHFFYKHK